MPLHLNFEWEEATVSTTLAIPLHCAPKTSSNILRIRMQPRQAAFYRNLIRLAEQTQSKVLPVSFITVDGKEKRIRISVA